MCFAASTRVATPSGPVAIADLPPSGLIVGPFGVPVKYENARRTVKSRPMLSVTLSNGKIVRCTPEHQWLTQHGWTEARHLTTRHLLLTPPSKSSTASATTFAAATFSAMVCDFIALSGNPSMGRSLTASMFTTLMAIDQIITRAILNCAPQARTLPSTTRAGATSFGTAGMPDWDKRCKSLLQNGTEARLGANGIAFTLNETGTNSLQGLESLFLARRAEKGLSSCEPVTSIVQELAHKRHEGSQVLTTSKGSALSAIASSLSTATAQNAAVLVPVGFALVGVTGLRLADPEDAYCLSSAAGSFALADGPVVSNCDALGYIVHRCFEVGRASAGKPVRGLRLY